MNKEEINISSLSDVYDNLNNALNIANSDLEKAGCIQYFEIAFELSWKILRRILKQNGIEINNPRDVFREAAKNNLIDDVEDWFSYIKMRNLTTHTYSHKYSTEVFATLPSFNISLKHLITKISS